jgi:hypothetical protein
MTSNNTDRTDPPGNGTIGDMLDLATRTAGSGNDLAIAAGQVIAKRVALGVAAAINPMAANHTEFARMVPEKVEAFSSAGMAMFEHFGEFGNRIACFASNEVTTTTRATIEMATCFDPLSMLEAQTRFVQAWWDRATANMLTFGMMTLSAQTATLNPIRHAVAANTERLG